MSPLYHGRAFRITVLGASGFAREQLMSWCEQHRRHHRASMTATVLEDCPVERDEFELPVHFWNFEMRARGEVSERLEKCGSSECCQTKHPGSLQPVQESELPV